jgi:N,N'-diacetyllegionaminate synthase
MKKVVDLGGRKVGPGHPVFVVAEAGINHNGSMDLALEMIEVAARMGVDAVKFQAYHSEEFLSSKDLTYTYVSQGKEVTESQYDMFKRCEFGRDEFVTLRDACHRRGLVFFATATDREARDMLLEIGVPAIKVGSDDLVHHPMLREFARTRQPIILSTGMADLAEVHRTLRAVEEAGADEVVVLHCTSMYPTPEDRANILRVDTLRRELPCPVGYSDHTAGITASPGAVALGACYVERHFTMDLNLPGPDHRFSANPQTMEALVRAIRETEKNVGSPIVEPVAEEMEMRAIARRSVVAKAPIAAGTTLTPDHFAYKRPGTGVYPMDEQALIGRRTRRAFQEGELITLESVE